MKFFATLLTGLLLSTHLVAQEAPQGLRCGPWRDFEKELKKTKNEELTGGVGLLGGGMAAVMIYVAPHGKTFTILVTQADGKSCIVSEGTDWSRGEVPIEDTI